MTPVEAMVRVASRPQAIEVAFEDAKVQVGLDQYKLPRILDALAPRTCRADAAAHVSPS